VPALWGLARGPPSPEEVGVSLDLTVTDLFCGAGGSSIGAEAMGARLRMAANHWRLAIETHSANFPDADHDCADVSQIHPLRYPSTDILLASPECTHHSQARSNKHRPDLFNPEGDPAAERSRATMWDVPRFAEHHRYQLVLVENVVEVAKWPPFDAWLQAMGSLGYRHKLLSINSAIAPSAGGAPQPPQLRDRLYVAFWRHGNPEPDLDFRPASWCPKCERVVEAVQVWKRPDRRCGKYRVDDCGFRMLEPEEIGRGMAFPGDYEVKGSKRDRVRQYGNAVTPPVPSMVLERLVETVA
jgi:DNA (cytosine-5)-methyltransferase 1